MDKKLMRSTSDRVVAGVCAGLAEYLNLDVTIVRVVFVLLTLMGGPGLLVYIILWFIMPENGYVGNVENPDEDIKL